ncbi:MAG: hypothetical protein K2N72_12325 [Oscillospiraceae bacterium]|nr:hypothetical protein [Oscillospiraceae bacterium]
MRYGKFLAVVLISALAFGTAGCSGDVSEVQQEQTNAVNEKSTDNEPRYRKAYNENGETCLIGAYDKIIPPFPNGWSGERINSMVSVDGYQLIFPCTVEDILNLSSDFRLDEDMQNDYNDGRSFFQIWYKSYIELSGIFYNDTGIIQMITVSGNEYSKIEDRNGDDPEALLALFDGFETYHDTVENLYSIHASYYEDNIIYNILTNARSGGVTLLWSEFEMPEEYSDFPVTEQENVTETEPEYIMEYDENGEICFIDSSGDTVPPFPEGWSGERINSMVSIDGYHLTLPCTVEDILNLSDDFKMYSPNSDMGDGTLKFSIWYKNVQAVSGTYYKDTKIMKYAEFIGNEYTKYEDCDSDNTDETLVFF